MMPRPSQDVTEAELGVLQFLWDHETGTVRELAENLYHPATLSDHATVQKLLTRLEEKGCVKRNRKTWPHVYQSMVDREDLIVRRLQATADDLCDGSFEPLLTNLVRAKRLSREDRRSLRHLLDELDQENRQKT